MRIALLAHSGCGGSGRVAAALACALTRAGHEVHLFGRRTVFGGWASEPGLILHTLARPEEAEDEPARLHSQWPSEDEAQLIDQLLRLHQARPLDVVHWHYGFPFASIAQRAVLAMARPGPALVGTLHGSELAICSADACARDTLCRALTACDRTTTVSDAHARRCVAALGLASVPLQVPNFLPVDWPWMDEPGPGRPALVVHLSNFRPIKRPWDTVEIFARAAEGLDARLDMIGDGECRAETEARIRSLGLQGRARILGLASDAGSRLRRASVMLISSQYESFSLAALEAQACGVPVVAPQVGGLPEVVEHEVTGLLFPEQDLDVAAMYLRRLLCEPALLEAMRHECLRRVRRFAAAAIVGQYLSLYEQLLRKVAA